MNDLEIAARIVGGLALILANGYFVAIEFALTRVRQYSEEEFDAPSLRRAWAMTDRLEIYLTSCQVGITASSIAVGIVAEPALAALFEPAIAGTWLASIGAGAILAFLIINLLHLTHGEQTPTYLGVERTKFVCRYGATPLYWFARAIYPVIALGDQVAKWTLGLFGVEMTGAWKETEAETIETRAQLRNRLGEVLNRGDLTEERRDEVLNALEVGERSVSEIMVPRDEIVAVSTERPFAENARIMRENPHTRFPLVGESLDDYRGNVYLPALFRDGATAEDGDGDGGDLDLEEIAHSPVTVEADTPISALFDEFQSQNQELAFALDDGAVVGMVTATDAFEAVMGELEDPLDRQSAAASA